jgi:polyisoprenoid-binding protein YceI
MTRLLALLLLMLPAYSLAAPLSYQLQPDLSRVSFSYAVNGGNAGGQMPVRSADIVLDLQNISASRADIIVDASRARAGFIVATEALKGASVLNTQSYPTIRFRSTAIRPNDPRNLSGGGKIDGQLTIRGVTRPVTLDVKVFRQRGAEPGDLSRLSFQISGAIRRSDFGATGFGNLVGDIVQLDIAASVRAN